MQTRLLNEAGHRVFAVVFDTGEEVTSGLLAFAREQSITGASLTAIGAFRDATLAFFDCDLKEYQQIPVREQVEVLTMSGNLGMHDGEPKLHAHVILGQRDGTARGGHLLEAHVRPTLEVVVIETAAYLRRRIDRATGLPLLDLGSWGSGGS